MSTKWTDAMLTYKLIQAMRKVYFMWGSRKSVLERNVRRAPRYKKDGTRHKVDLKQLQCECCGAWVQTKNFNVDHIEPVIRCDWMSKDIGLSVPWDTYVKRLFCSEDNLWGLCKDCHDDKTLKEKNLRLMWRRFREGREEKPEWLYIGKDFNEFEVFDKSKVRRK